MSLCASGTARVLDDCETLLTPENASAEEIWFRQAPRTLVDGQDVSPDALAPTRVDDATSGARSTKTTAKAAYEGRMPNTTGTYALFFEQIWAFPDLRLIDDSDCPVSPGETRPPGHTVIDWSGMIRRPRKCRQDARELLAEEINSGMGRVHP